MGTKVTIDAGIAEVNDTPVYRLYGHCTACGDLLDKSIFLLEIVDTDVPADDLLYRIVQISDFVGPVAYGQNRDQAIRDGISYWRSAQFANYYTDVQVAANAKQVFQDEVNQLVANYETYSNQFKTASQEVEFPNSTIAATDALKGAYDTALTSYSTALETQEAADAALLAAQGASDDIGEWLGRKADLEAALTDRWNEIKTAKILYNAFLGTGIASDAAWIIAEIKEFIAAYDADGSGVDAQRETLENDKNDFSAQRTQAMGADVDSVITQAVSEHFAMIADVVTDYIPYSSTDQDTADAAVTSAQTAKVTAHADVAAKYITLEAAYDAAKAVCPDWTPDNPLPAEPFA